MLESQTVVAQVLGYGYLPFLPPPPLPLPTPLTGPAGSLPWSTVDRCWVVRRYSLAQPCTTTRYTKQTAIYKKNFKVLFKTLSLCREFVKSV